MANHAEVIPHIEYDQFHQRSRVHHDARKGNWGSYRGTKDDEAKKAAEQWRLQVVTIRLVPIARRDEDQREDAGFSAPQRLRASPFS
jgi:hypothetical protein